MDLSLGAQHEITRIRMQVGFESVWKRNHRNQAGSSGYCVVLNYPVGRIGFVHRQQECARFRSKSSHSTERHKEQKSSADPVAEGGTCHHDGMKEEHAGAYSKLALDTDVSATRIRGLVVCDLGYFVNQRLNVPFLHAAVFARNSTLLVSELNTAR
jgi:hypothetical protein